MVNLHKAAGYREFLREHIAELKAQDAKFSLRFLSAKMGASEAYLKNVVAGKRTLSVDRAIKLAKVLKLGSAERDYFVLLVMRDECDTREARLHFDRQLSAQRREQILYQVGRRMPTVFSDALLWEIYTLISVDGFKGDPAWISRRLTRRGITVKQVEKALERLKSLHAIAGEGAQMRAQDVILMDSALVRDAYRAALKRSLQYLEEQPKADEHFDAFCCLLSDGEFDEIKSVLAQARAQLIAIVRRKESSSGKRRIAFYNANLFWSSR